MPVFLLISKRQNAVKKPITKNFNDDGGKKGEENQQGG
jgi:hypothetical protein